MARCENMVSQTYYRGFGHRTVALRCGSTSLQGLPLECGECREKRVAAKKPPPGYCRHGVYILTDHDIPCGQCEMGED